MKRTKLYPVCGKVFRKLLAVIAVLAGTLVATESAMAEVSRVYWTDRDNATLSVTDLSSGQTQVLVPGTGGRLQDVDLDSTTGILFFADWGPVGFPGSQGSINQVNRDGTGLATVFNTGDGVHQLALDQVNQLIYFTRAVSYDDHEVSVVDYAGGNNTVFLSGGFGGPGWFPSGLALDPVNSLLYWGDIGVLNFPLNGSVNRMTTAGAAQTQLTPHVNGRGRGYALDQASQTIFFTSHDPQSPSRGGGLFSYDIASGIETLLIDDPGTGYWDIEIDPVDQRIWWVDYGRGQIHSANFDGTDVVIELSDLTNPYGLALEIIGVLEIEIDIKPGSDSNPINLKSKGVIPIAILGSGDFDVAEVDIGTLQLNGSTGPAHASSHLEDINGDGHADLVSHYSTRDSGIAAGDSEACVTGETVDGRMLNGCDSVRVK